MLMMSDNYGRININGIVQRYENLSVGDFMELKQTLHAFFQDRRIKVSLFLQEGLQTSSGAMVFPELEFLPPGVMIPNTIRYSLFHYGILKNVCKFMVV